MEITNVRVRLSTEAVGNLVGYASITLDDEFMIHDIRIIKTNGRYFTAMPSRKITDHCKQCNAKNPLQNAYCGNCGHHIGAVQRGDNSRYHKDVAHPLNSDARKRTEDAIIQSYLEEVANHKEATTTRETSRMIA